MTAAPKSNDVLYDITNYLEGSSMYGGDRAYSVQQSRLGMGLVIAATDIDSMERSDWELVLRPREPASLVVGGFPQTEKSSE